MNRLPANSIIVSAILALTMWLFVTWFQQPIPVRQTGLLPETPPAAPAVEAPAEAPRSCDVVEAEMRDLVEQARACSTDSDCAIFDYGYPIECLMSVARDSISSLRLEFRRYHQSCEYRVYYDCPTGDMRRMPVCRQNRCEVRLVTLDTLKDQTLDHLEQ